MAAQYNIHDAKTQLSRLAERAANGEEIIIARDGRPLAARGRRCRPGTEACVSAATSWEIEIKQAQGRLRVDRDMAEHARQANMLELPITCEHAREAGRLPRLHGDPFDRMLIAQARIDRLTLATADRQIMRYDVPVLEVSPS